MGRGPSEGIDEPQASTAKASPRLDGDPAATGLLAAGVPSLRQRVLHSGN